MDDIIKNMKRTEDSINKLYDNLGYFDTYGGSFLVCVILTILIFLVISYFHVLKNIQPIKDDWVVQRCNPTVIPFAGFINKPDDETIYGYTEKNMAFCVQNILTSMTGYFVEPITNTTLDLTNLYSKIATILQSMRMMISNIRTSVAKIATEIFGRIANIIIPIQTIMIKFRDFIGKLKAVLVTGIYTSMGAFLALKSLFGSIVQIVILCLVIFGGVIIGLWISGFFFFPNLILAGVSTVLFALILALMVPLIIFMKTKLGSNGSFSLPGLPKKPKLCFDKDVLLQMNDGLTMKKIKDIVVGDVLHGGNRVTAKLKLDSSGVQMYCVGEAVVVSGSHQMKYKNKWIRVEECPERRLLADYDVLEPFIYCLNTESKRIVVSGIEMYDWDEISDDEFARLLKYDSELTCKTIHSRFNKGFLSTTTTIKLLNGVVKRIEEVCIGDILVGNCRVVGVVKMLGYYSELILYHVLTDTGYFYLENGVLIQDYNSCIDNPSVHSRIND